MGMMTVPPGAAVSPACSHVCRWHRPSPPLTGLPFVFKVTLLSFAVESECTFLDYIKGG